jgi:hypothetical protein
MLNGYITYQKFGWLVGEMPIGGDAGKMVSHGWFVVCLIDSLRKLFVERVLQRFYFRGSTVLYLHLLVICIIVIQLPANLA